MGLVLSKKVRSVIEKNKYAFLIVLVGIGLMLLPTPTQETEQSQFEAEVRSVPLQTQLEQILSHIHGAGEVHVLLTEEKGKSNIYQTDLDTDNDQSGSSEQSRTVLVTTSDRNEEGLILRIDPPIYQGAVVVCQGAGSPQVRLAIMEAVSCATGLSSNKISIVKME